VPRQQPIEVFRPSTQLRPPLNLSPIEKRCLRRSQDLAHRVARQLQVARDLPDRCPERNARAVSDRSSPQSASPTARFAPKQAAEQIGNQGVNFGRRSPASGGHFSTPKHTRPPPSLRPASYAVSRTRQRGAPSLPAPAAGNCNKLTGRRLRSMD